MLSLPPFQILPNDTKYILPTADSRPVTINNGFEMTAWYDVLDLKEDGDEVGKRFKLHKITIAFPP